MSDLYWFVTKDTVAISDTVSFDDITKVYETDNALHRNFISKSCRKKYDIFQCKKFFGAPVRKLISRDIIGDRQFNVDFKNGEDTLFFFLISDRIKYSRISSGAAIYYRRCRPNSAHFMRKKRIEKIKLGLKLMVTLSKYYLKNPTHYNLLFFVTRLLGSAKIMIS